MNTEEILLPGQLYQKEQELKQIFLANVQLIPEGERIKQCIQCGTCTGSCPVSYKMEITPRQIISYFRAGEISKILQSNSIWLCISCYSCQTRCPSLIKVTDIIYALKQTALTKNIYSKKTSCPSFERYFYRNDEEKWSFKRNLVND